LSPELSKLPNFFIIGAPKAGTTSLYHYLDQHPQIYMSAIKEPHFFATEFREENFAAELRPFLARETRGLRGFLSSNMRRKRFGGIVAEWEDYVRLFADASHESALGEASVCYLWSPTAPERISRRFPDAKILVMLRDPVERAYSQYLHGLGNGAIRWSFREHIRRNLRHRSGELCIHYPFLELGLYAEQLSRYLQRFGRNVWVGFQRDFKQRPLEVFQSICRFLSVDPGFSPDMSSRHLEAEIPRTPAIGWLKRSGTWQAASRATPSRLRPLIRRALMCKPGSTRIRPEDRHYLIDFYREDIRKLSSLLNRELDGWLK
jgi:hypothetical protein